MKITSIECWTKKIKLTEAYTVAYEHFDTASQVFLKLGTSSGITGFGCAAPDVHVTGETAEEIHQLFLQTAEAVLHQADPFSYAYLLNELKKQLHKHPSALAMMDMALFDLLAKKAGLPLYKLLGGFRDSIPTSITIGIMPVQESVERARAFVQQGFKILKVKGGNDPKEDAERVRKIRETAGPEVEIRFDANQGFNVKEALQFIQDTEAAGIELLEQPTRKDNVELLKEITHQTPLPVMADESLLSLKDVFRISKHKAADLVNIKLMKAGGIQEAMHINSVAKAAGIEAMIGCMDESELGISAGLHFALSRPNITYADLDGHLDLQEDPFAGAVILKDGILYPTEKPGLGI